MKSTRLIKKKARKDRISNMKWFNKWKTNRKIVDLNPEMPIITLCM